MLRLWPFQEFAQRTASPAMRMSGSDGAAREVIRRDRRPVALVLAPPSVPSCSLPFAFRPCQGLSVLLARDDIRFQVRLLPPPPPTAARKQRGVLPAGCSREVRAGLGGGGSWTWSERPLSTPGQTTSAGGRGIQLFARPPDFSLCSPRERPLLSFLLSRPLQPARWPVPRASKFANVVVLLSFLQSQSSKGCVRYSARGAVLLFFVCPEKVRPGQPSAAVPPASLLFISSTVGKKKRKGALFCSFGKEEFAFEGRRLHTQMKPSASLWVFAIVLGSAMLRAHSQACRTERQQCSPRNACCEGLACAPMFRDEKNPTLFYGNCLRPVQSSLSSKPDRPPFGPALPLPRDRQR
ncbi:uncharacterized protein LOC144094892 isoform X1 [Amblyomma americanum]